MLELGVGCAQMNSCIFFFLSSVGLEKKGASLVFPRDVGRQGQVNGACSDVVIKDFSCRCVCVCVFCSLLFWIYFPVFSAFRSIFICCLLCLCGW